MGIFDFGAKGAKEVIDSGAGLVDSIAGGLDNLFTSDEERAIWETKGKEIVAGVVAGVNARAQELNLINAKDSRWFHSAWRPFMGWIAAFSIGAYFLPKFVLASWAYYLKVQIGIQEAIEAGTIAAYSLPVYPVDDSGLWQLVTLLLGAVGVRSADKYLGTAKS